jgi:hypothetical protein
MRRLAEDDLLHVVAFDPRHTPLFGAPTARLKRRTTKIGRIRMIRLIAAAGFALAVATSAQAMMPAGGTRHPECQKKDPSLPTTADESPVSTLRHRFPSTLLLANVVDRLLGKGCLMQKVNR